MALEQAAKAESELCSRRRGGSQRDRGPLHGIPISLKDNIYTKGVRTTGGSKILREFVPLCDAPVVRLLKKAGAVMVGKTNLHEFAYGVTTENPHFGRTRNPWDLERIPGGSSGGSAAAVASGLCYGSIGTDTGGSVRIPAALCGVVGLKPGLGRVSAENVIPLSRTLDFVGPLARSVEDATALLGAILRSGEKEARRSRLPFSSSGGPSLALGIPREFFLEILDPEVRTAFDNALGILKKRGVRLKDVTLPMLSETEDAGNQIAWAEATEYHQQAGWFPERAEEYGEDVRMRLEMGTQVTAVGYLRAIETREKFIQSFHGLLAAHRLDALVFPTTPIAAPKMSEENIAIDGAIHSTRALLLRLNRPANLAGVPAISVPCGLTKSGLPIGLQFMAGGPEERLLLGMALGFERECAFRARPNLDPVC